MAQWPRGPPRGWQTTPEGITVGRHFWRQFFTETDPLCDSAGHVTVLNFGTSQRRAMTRAERYRELAAWWGRMLDRPALASELTLASLAKALARMEQVRHRLEQRTAEAKGTSREA